jgi:uncharacterized membrane protein HdeD (DUF308 family)
VPVEGGPGDPGGGDELLDPDRVDPLGVEDPAGCTEQPVAGLLFLYPAVDAAAAVVDARSTRWSATLSANLAVSALAAVGLALAGASGVPAVLRVWGAWAIVAGLIQLAVGLSRRRPGGQWAMIAAGGLSAVVGAGFIVSAGSATSVTSVAGYAVVGGIFFLVSALRLRRTAHAAVVAGQN